MGNKTEKPVVKTEVKQAELITYFMIVQQKLLQLKNKAQADITKKKGEIKAYLKSNNIDGAKLKMETIISHEEKIAAYEKLGFQAETLKEKVALILYSERCPEDIRGILDTMVYASFRINMEEFQKLRELIGIKYGAGYISEAEGNILGLIDTSIIKNLTVKKISEGAIITRLKLLNDEDNMGYEFSDTFEPSIGEAKKIAVEEKNSFNPNFNQSGAQKDFSNYNQGGISGINQQGFPFNSSSQVNQQSGFNQQQMGGYPNQQGYGFQGNNQNDVQYPKVSGIQYYPELGGQKIIGQGQSNQEIKTQFQNLQNNKNEDLPEDFPNAFNPDNFPTPKNK
jgi:hypothetical protein